MRGARYGDLQPSVVCLGGSFICVCILVELMGPRGSAKRAEGGCEQHGWTGPHPCP